MSEDFLENILVHKKKVNKEKESYYAAIRQQIVKSSYSRYELFKRKISQPGQVNLIAEIKKASPSQGMLRTEFDLLGIAKIYADNNAAAISVLTEDKYFLGKPIYVKQVSDHLAVPVLTKDFIIDEGQIFEAHANGASAVLLIVTILEQKQLRKFIQLAQSLDLDCLVEVFNEKELGLALEAGADIIGINNRDLRTFKVDQRICEELVSKIPQGIVIVAESGIKTHADIKKFQGLGVHAVLIGEVFMRENDIAQKIKEVMSGK